MCKDYLMKPPIDLQTCLWYVHFMNAPRAVTSGTEQFKSLQILDELSSNDSLTQRDLSGRLGIALGLVNSYVKNLVAKGFITVKSIPPKRYAYYLTPKGFAEKTRLTYDLLQDYTRIYREARRNLKNLFHDLQQNGMKRVVFAGADEVTEIAYISLQESTLELTGIIDDDNAGKNFLGMDIKPVNALEGIPHDCILVTSYLKQNAILKTLTTRMGINRKKLRTLF
jgi:DNA-binding MarR family transcriptional regulator